MQDIGDDYQALLDGHVPTSHSTVPFFSSVTGKAIFDSNKLGPSYWKDNLESPVLFYTATRAILTSAKLNEPYQNQIFVEVGPHSALAGPLRQIFKDVESETSPIYIPTMVRGQNCTESLLTAVGQLHLQGAPIDFEALTSGKNVLTNLPLYPWCHDMKYWNESRITREWRMREFPQHELLGSRILGDNEFEPIWRNMLRLEDVRWLQDHKIIDDIVYPAAGYIAMAGEAIRQITNIDDFTLKQVVIKTALVLQESKTVEIMTSLRSVRFTSDLDSSWYEFSISSYNGTSWTKNCIGQVRAGSDQPIRPREIERLTRKVSASAWYSAMKRVGLNYGSDFQGMTDVTASPNSQTAVATLFDRFRSSETEYQLHPTTIDLCLQLFTVGMSQGVTRLLSRLCVPTHIEKLYIRKGSPEIRVEVVTSSTINGAIRGDAIATAGSEVVLHLEQGKFSPLEDDIATEGSDTVAGAQLYWKPDVTFVSCNSLMRPYTNVRAENIKLEKLALLCMLETRIRVSSIDTQVDHLKKFRSWLNLQALRAEKGEYDLIEDAQALARLSPTERLTDIDAASKEVENSIGAEIGKVLLRILDKCEAIFNEEVDPIEVLHQGYGLQNIYSFFQDMWDCRDFFELVSHENPNLRILEIGAGTGGTTAGVLGDLTSEFDERMYSEYHYTDISAGFFIAAKERFQDYQNIHYAVLDISKDPIEQGFQAESYDIILASNVGL